MHPLINIVDGIVALEGEGSAKKGKLKECNILVFSDDTLSADYVIAQILNLPLNKNPLIDVAIREKIFDLREVEIYLPYSDFRIDNFCFSPISKIERIPTPFVNLLKFFLNFYPSIEKKRCTGCERCIRTCPNDAIKIENGKVIIDYRKCILCMCWNEVWEFSAIKLNKSFLLRLIG